MISKSKIKLINSLSLKKFRDETGLFITEGTKLTTDLTSVFECILLLATPEWLEQNTSISAVEKLEISSDELKKISNQKTPQGVLAIFKKTARKLTEEDFSQDLCLALDGIQDPGNLGTILRVADWFGIRHVFCSENSADVYSPKTVQATMGALARVNVQYVNLPDFLQQLDSKIPVYGTFMKSQNIYTTSLTPNGIIVMGNEGNGISAEVECCIKNRILIPNFPEGAPTSESLNVGVATALVCAEFRRRI